MRLLYIYNGSNRPPIGSIYLGAENLGVYIHTYLGSSRHSVNPWVFSPFVRDFGLSGHHNPGQLYSCEFKEALRD